LPAAPWTPNVPLAPPQIGMLGGTAEDEYAAGTGSEGPIRTQFTIYGGVVFKTSLTEAKGQ
jgi:hypothetical protein